MTKYKFTVPFVVCLVAMVGFALTAPSVGDNSKVNLALQKSLQSNFLVNIIISMGDGIDAPLAKVARSTYADRGAQAQAVYDALNEQATVSQKDVLSMLNSSIYCSTKVKSFWISNQIYVQGADAILIQALAGMDSVSSIDEELIITLEEVVPDPQEKFTAEWGIDMIEARSAWFEGSYGSGAIVGIIDTGARYTHEALIDNYRGGTHSWFNPYSNTQNPGDGHGHGTHCTGTIAGTVGIGVALRAKWISCKGLEDTGSGTQSSLLACGQFMLCPTTYNGANTQCGLAPHVVNNSWGGTPGGGTWFDGVMRSWKGANIIPIFSNGNKGPSCGTSGSPGDSAEGLSVGATTDTDRIASFSSRGPGPSTRQKPDVSAPGNLIRSAGHLSDTAYATMSGTSMAAPHVAGLVALLKGKSPGASYATIKSILESTADRDLSFGSEICSGIPEIQFPNYAFGFGRISAIRAVRSLAQKQA